MREQGPGNAERPVAETLAGVLGAVLGRDVPVEAYGRLAGGLANRSYRVRSGGDEYVVRLPARGRRHALEPSIELGALVAAARAGLAPSVVGLERGTGALVTEYVRAPHWRTDDARAPANVERAAALLRRLHAVPPPAALPAYAPVDAAREYIERAAAPAGLEPADRRLASELERLARGLDSHDAGTVFCHNDLVAANVLDAGRLVLVDFEYAVRAAPVLDLASLASMNAFGADERRILLDAYGGEPCDAAELDAATRMLRLLAYFWARALAEETGDAASYADFADRSALIGESE